MWFRRVRTKRRHRVGNWQHQEMVAMLAGYHDDMDGPPLRTWFLIQKSSYGTAIRCYAWERDDTGWYPHGNLRPLL